MNAVTYEVGEGRSRVCGWAVPCGEDASITLTGGTLPHVGAVSLAVYEPERDSATVSTMTVFSHRDDACAAPCAKAASRLLKANVTVSVGIHIDAPQPTELQALSDNCLRCCKELAVRLLEQKNDRKEG